ncbi:metal ABC transporter substrate-binding protein [Pseudactinotalea terrae]|uniref:metal ABC transporter substrate-binding protein n=1 Tax=Pseudactinotalea terrae TaxID=1743262 RepID=UPI0012E24E09|nr:metal ABC transporter substrate-binding protein [Pseudactinotalea terrae]
MTTDPRSRRIAAAAVLALAAGTAACSPAHEEGLQVWVSFAPLEYLVERVGGPEVQVDNLTPPGADPHSQELSPARVADLAAADLVVYVSGLQPSTDEAIEQAEPAVVVDTLDAATAAISGEPNPPDPSRDPHFWLDPIRFGEAAQQIADALATIAPEHADDYRDRAGALLTDLDQLDAEYAEALSGCAGATLVTSHEAFGYLAARYGLRQEGITGIDPEVEPSPARLRDLAAIIEEAGVSTIYFETAADPAVAETLAADLGLRTDVLDPMERPSDPDYLTVMQSNLTALQDGLVCDQPR